MKLILLCLLCMTASAQRRKDGKDGKEIPEARYAIADAVNTFGAELLVEFRDAYPTSSIVFSPFSIASAFNLLYQGARGKTAEELESLFGFKVIDRYL